MRRSRYTHFILALSTFISAPTIASADEGGVSFWVPGLFGSLAAVPQQAGWSLSTAYCHDNVSAGADVARAREVTIGRIPINLNVNFSADLNSKIDLALITPSYVFKTPVLGGQLAVGLMGVYGRVGTSLAATLSGTVGTPFGTFPFSRFDSISDSVTGLATSTRKRFCAGTPASQLHGLHYRGHTGWSLRLDPLVQYRHRAWRG